MANIASQIKRNRQALVRNERNKATRSALMISGIMKSSNLGTTRAARLAERWSAERPGWSRSKFCPKFLVTWRPRHGVKNSLISQTRIKEGCGKRR